MMTTSLTPFIPFLAAFGALVPGSAAVFASGPQDGRVIRLPEEEAPQIRGARERLHGRHLSWDYDDEVDQNLFLGPVIPRRTLTSLIERQVDQQGGRDAGISVESLGPVLLIRGGSEGPSGSASQAAETARATVREFEAIAQSLRFATHVKLTAIPAEGAGEPTTVIDDSMVLTSGTRGAFGSRSTRPVVADFDVEVASSISIADPVIANVETGETVHLWASTVVDEMGQRRLHVQGLLDLAWEVGSESFDPDVYELGVLEQPTIRTVQVMFASTIQPGEPLVVTLDGLPGLGPMKLPGRRLEITAEPSGTQGKAAPIDSHRVVDLSRGMWRAGLGLPHALWDDDLQVTIPEARMPASAAQLITLVFGRDAGLRPDLGSTIVLLPGGDAARNAEVQALFEGVDPVGPRATVTVNSRRDGWSASLPAVRGALLRVAQTEETVFIVDYDPQIANDAVLSDPRAELSIAGSVFEGSLESGPDGLRLNGFISRRTIEGVTVRKSDPIDVGKIQHAATTREAARVLVKSGETESGAGLDVTLTPR